MRASTMPLRPMGSRSTIPWYVRSTVCALNWSLRCHWVVASLATTMRPVVPMSSLCTMPGRSRGGVLPAGGGAPAGASNSSSAKIGSSSSDSAPGSGQLLRKSGGACPGARSRAGRPQWCSTAFTSVPVGWPGAGCTTMPAALLTTIRCSSSNTISRGMSSGLAVVVGGGGSAHRTMSPARTLVCFCTCGLPLTVTRPRRMPCCSLARLTSGSSFAK
mmetsp:Transcript_670/g.1949  ORF Transcript_670/g.1949 Transcript_670/m.1949 type:complete len:217 (-) Transcript_670:400-1050(-)